MKKLKKDTMNLYNFNEYYKEENNKKKNNKKRKKYIPKEKNKIGNEQNKFDFNNEIVIGISSQENKKNESKKESNKKKSVQKNKRNNKVNKKKKLRKKNKKSITKRKINIKIIKYIILTTCILGIIIAIMFSPLFNVKEIIVEGNKKISTDEIISLSQINIDENTYKISKRKVEKNILENPYIKEIEINRVLPSKVKITIQERVATFMIEYGNSYVYINNQGYILEIASEKIDMPILQGVETIIEEFIPGNRLCMDDLEKLSTVIKIMESSENNGIANLITRIDIENSQNYKILFEDEQKIAYLGDATDLNDKIPNIVTILDKEKGVAGEIFVNMDLKKNNPIFRQSV